MRVELIVQIGDGYLEGCLATVAYRIATSWQSQIMTTLMYVLGCVLLSLPRAKNLSKEQKIPFWNNLLQAKTFSAFVTGIFYPYVYRQQPRTDLRIFSTLL